MANVEKKNWGIIDGKKVQLFTLTNANGLVMKVTNYGCIVTELHLPDRDGNMADVALGFDSLDGYIAGHPSFGAICGRCANRIADGRFEIDGKTFQVSRNHGPHHLHGGVKGFEKQVWDAEADETADGPRVRFTRQSPEGEEGYPGTLDISVTYTLTNEDAWVVEMEATTDRPTLCNVVQHIYWNLAGHGSGTVEDHVLQLDADEYTVPGELLIPTGEIDSVVGAGLDFREPKRIGEDLHQVGEQPAGYDHNYVLRGEGEAMRRVGEVFEPTSGRTMMLHTNQPGVQLYTGNFLDGSLVGKGGVAYEQYAGVCLETQKSPDAVHHPAWPSPVLRPGERYSHVMRMKFGVR